MRLFFVFSGDDSQESDLPAAYLKSYDDAFAQRVIMHLTNDANLCTGCASFCEHCRDQYPIQFAEDIVGLLQLPSSLPVYIDDAAEYLPDELEPHDVTIAINVHEDLLLSLPALAKRAGSVALIVPQDDTAWLSPGVRRQVQRICDELGLESAFPKPACALDAREDQVHIREFQNTYKIGKPKIVIQSRDGVIREARVVQSAPCGNTYYVAYNLAGQEIGPDLNERVVSKYWHSFPCVGSMLTDPELGDSILHKGLGPAGVGDHQAHVYELLEMHAGYIGVKGELLCHLGDGQRVTRSIDDGSVYRVAGRISERSGNIQGLFCREDVRQ